MQGGIILDLGSGRYRVSSQSRPDSYYEVTVMDNCWKCTCPYHTHGNRRCKHVCAVQGLVERVRRAGRDTVVIGDPGVVCVKCGGADGRHRETRNRKNGVSERYVCRDCGKKFTHNPGFAGRHYGSDAITDALQDVATGKSPAQAAQSLSKRGRMPDQSTVWRWTKRFGHMLKRLSDSVAHRVGYEWSADEIYYRVLGNEMWLFGVMDVRTRFIIDYDASPDKIGYDATDIFAAALRLAGEAPDIVTTDALPGFAKGLVAAMPGGKRSGVIHRKDVGVRKRHANNNIYERFNGTIKDRIRCVRGFRTRLPALHVLILAHYNLFRPHSGISGRTPAEALGVVLEGPDRWLTAIRHTVLFCA